MGRSTPTMAEALAYWEQHSGLTSPAVAAHFDGEFTPGQLRAARSRATRQAQAASESKVQRTDVRKMAADDLAELVETVRDIRASIRIAARRLRAAFEREEYLVDKDTAQALRAYQQMANDLVKSHPGLMELVDDGDDGGAGAGPLSGGDALERVRRALGRLRPDRET